MRAPTIALLTAMLSVAGAGSAFAQWTGGIAADPTTRDNTVPAPSTQNPTNPSAASNPYARIPTAPPWSERMGAFPNGNPNGAPPQ